MSAANNPATGVHTDTRINVASLLMEPVGATRDLAWAIEALPLDSDTGLTARTIEGTVRFTRLRHSLLAEGRFTGTVALECVRCLTEYDQPFEATFSEEYRQSVDVRTGAAIPPDPGNHPAEEDEDEETAFVIDESHELDIAEAVRQWILLALPMRPSCGDQCPGPLLTQTDPETVGDNRFADLARLLGDDDGNEEQTGHPA